MLWALLLPDGHMSCQVQLDVGRPGHRACVQVLDRADFPGIWWELGHGGGSPTTWLYLHIYIDFITIGSGGLWLTWQSLVSLCFIYIYFR
jgi:hypothetical protein